METNINTNPNLDPMAAQGSELSSGKKQGYNLAIGSFCIDSTGHFNKVHKRRFHSFGCIHQFGHSPGAGF